MNKHSSELFLEACGATGPLELSIESQTGQDAVQRTFYQPFVLIGREPRSTLLLNHAQVGRQHAYLQLIGGRVFCMDLQSRSGTYWETGPKRGGWVDYGQSIRIGPYQIRPVNTNGRSGADISDNGSQAPAQGHGQPDLPQVTLEFINQTGTSRTWPMLPILALVGKSPECRVHLVGESVSAFHCSLVRTPLGLWVVDLLGRGGIWVNDMVMRCSRLDEGDRLQVGRFLMCIHYDAQPKPGDLAGPGHERALDGKESRPHSPSEPSPAANLVPEIVLAPTTPISPRTEDSPAPSRELMPVAADQPMLPGDATSAQLVPFARQLGQMQQQMFDQFQQAMMMMFQMFNTLQRDQMGVIRQELDHLHQLTQELQKFQMELAKGSQPASAASSAKRQGAAAGQTGGGPIKNPRGAQPTEGRGPSARPKKQAQSGLTRAKSTQRKMVTPASPIENSPVAPQPIQTDEAFHAWLAARIAEIQQERQTRWQRVVNFLTKK